MFSPDIGGAVSPHLTPQHCKSEKYDHLPHGYAQRSFFGLGRADWGVCGSKRPIHQE